MINSTTIQVIQLKIFHCVLHFFCSRQFHVTAWSRHCNRAEFNLGTFIFTVILCELLLINNTIKLYTNTARHLHVTKIIFSKYYQLSLQNCPLILSSLPVLWNDWLVVGRHNLKNTWQSLVKFGYHKPYQLILHCKRNRILSHFYLSVINYRR